MPSRREFPGGVDCIPNMYVEQDQTELLPLESLRIGYSNLAKYLHA
jgi:hypothetical protein